MQQFLKIFFQRPLLQKLRKIYFVRTFDPSNNLFQQQNFDRNLLGIATKMSINPTITIQFPPPTQIDMQIRAINLLMDLLIQSCCQFYHVLLCHGY
jgi:hypothetical protein